MLTLACVAAVLPACLITDRKHYQEAPSLPPSIVTTPASYPLDRVIFLDDVGSADASVGELQFDVTVREPNANDPLKVRVFVNRPSAATGIEAFRYLKFDNVLPTTLASDRPWERPFGFVIDTTSAPFDPLRCNKIELVVASDWNGAITPVDPNEFARVVWWAAPRGTDIATCP